jgi:hypothetical protein
MKKLNIKKLNIKKLNIKKLNIKKLELKDVGASRRWHNSSGWDLLAVEEQC